MFGLGSIASALGSFLGGPLTAITGQIAGVFTNKQNTQQAEFIAMSQDDRDATLALLKAQTDLNTAKVGNNAHGAAYFFVWLFGLGPALHWSMVYIVSTPPFSWWGWSVSKLPPTYAASEEKIALSFFVLAPALPVLSGLASRLRG